MNPIEDRINNAADEMRRDVAAFNGRPASSVRGRHQRRRIAMGTMVVAAVLGLSGLGAFIALDPAGLDAATGGTGTTTSVPVTAAVAETSESEEAPMPVLSAAVQTAIDWHWTRENARAVCMAERGFEYVPYVRQRTLDDMALVYGDPARDGRTIEEMLDTNGEYFHPLFNIDSVPLSQRELENTREGMALTGWHAILGKPPVASSEDALDEQEDPNTALRKQLEGTPEWDGYWRAFQGWTGNERADGTATEEDTYNSCMSIAERAAGPEPQSPTSALYDEVYSQADMNTMREFASQITQLVDTDPRMAAAGQATDQCLLDLGYGTTNLQEYMYDLVHDELRAAGVDDPFFRGVTSYEERERLHIEALGAERVAELQALESRLAVATIDCAIPRSAVHREVIRDYERQMLEQNPGLVELVTRW